MLRGAARIFSAEKSFGHAWVGHATLNRLGLHLARIGLADAALWLRRRSLPSGGSSAELATLRRDGVLIVPAALPAARFDAVAAEVRARVRAADARCPRPANGGERGFGAKRPFAGGFDRFDGGTLNRFVDVTEADTPRTWEALRSAHLARPCALGSGFRHRPERFQIYVTVAGDERTNPDPQRALHRDTFHSTVKVWLFLDDVRAADGPFEYVIGSHRVDRRRAAWEHQRARAASAVDATARGGSFRITEPELARLGLPAPRAFPVAANTLVVADVRGFHRRGGASPGAERLALYGNLRLWPFAPVAF